MIYRKTCKIRSRPCLTWTDVSSTLIMRWTTSQNTGRRHECACFGGAIVASVRLDSDGGDDSGVVYVFILMQLGRDLGG